MVSKGTGGCEQAVPRTRVRADETHAGRVRHMRRSATREIEAALALVCADPQQPALRRVAELSLFGSYARGALAVGDVDLLVDLDLGSSYRGQDGRLVAFPADTPGVERPFFASEQERAQGGREDIAVGAAMQVLRAAGETLAPLPNTREGLVAQFPDAHPLLLWQRGEPLQAALDRLEAIAADPAAGHAARTAA